METTTDKPTNSADRYWTAYNNDLAAQASSEAKKAAREAKRAEWRNKS